MRALVKSDRYIGVTDNVLFEVFQWDHSKPDCLPGSVVGSQADILLYFGSEVREIFAFYLDQFHRDASERVRLLCEQAGTKGMLVPSKFIIPSGRNATTVNLLLPVGFVVHQRFTLNSEGFTSWLLGSVSSSPQSRPQRGRIAESIAARTDAFWDDVVNWLASLPGVKEISEDPTDGRILICEKQDGRAVRFLLKLDAVSEHKGHIPFEVLVVDHEADPVPTFSPGVGWLKDMDFVIFARANDRRIFVARQDELKRAANVYVQQQRTRSQIRAWVDGGFSRFDVLVLASLVNHDEYSLDDEEVSPFA